MEITFEQAPIALNRAVSIVIFANPGGGKSTLAATLPEDSTVIVSAEGGMVPFMGKKTRIFNVKKTMELNPSMSLEEIIATFYRHIRIEDKTVKYIVIDNISELRNILIEDYRVRRKKPYPEKKEYGDASWKVREWVLLFRDLSYQGINVIFNAWESQMEMKSSTGEVINMSIPLLGDNASLQMCGYVDAVGYIYTRGGQWLVNFSPSTMHLTKTQWPSLGREEANLMTIISKIGGVK